MRIHMVTALMVVATLCSSYAVEAGTLLNEDYGDVGRCAYLGRCGSFHLTGRTGTAAYILGSQEFFAELAFTKEDEDFWYYEPTDGDDSTSLWAFARKRYCGKYAVWRLDRAGWHRFERTRAWGEGLDRRASSGAAAQDNNSAIEDLQLRFQDLQSDVKELQLKVQNLESNKSP